MQTDHRKLDALEKTISDILRQIDPELARDWTIKTIRIVPTRQIVNHILAIAMGYDNAAPVFPKSKVKWEITSVRLPFFGRFSFNRPKIFSPRRNIERVAALIREFALEIAKDVGDEKDVFSVVKTENGGHRFYNPDGFALSDIHSGEWPTDRLMAGAERLAVRYFYSPDEVVQWKQDFEAWLLRSHGKCPQKIKNRIGARKL